MYTQKKDHLRTQREKAVACKPSKKASGELKDLGLGLLASRTVRKHICCSSSPVGGILFGSLQPNTPTCLYCLHSPDDIQVASCPAQDRRGKLVSGINLKTRSWTSKEWHTAPSSFPTQFWPSLFSLKGRWNTFTRSLFLIKHRREARISNAEVTSVFVYIL